MKKSLLVWTTLFVIAGTILAACSDTAPASLAGEWKLISYGSAASPTLADPNTETSLTLGIDGALNGNLGCNTFSGSYKVKGSNVTFSSLASTLMACADPIMQQESTVFHVLNGTAAFNLVGNTLTVTSADGNTIVVLERILLSSKYKWKRIKN